MTEQKERIAAKVRKLLAIAEDDAASAAEIQNAMNFAQRMMDAHHLTEEDLAHEPSDDYQKVNDSFMKEYRSFIGKKAFYWEQILATFVCKFVGCEVYLDHSKRPARTRTGFALRDSYGEPYRGKSVVFYGVAEDAAIAADVYDELRSLIGSMAQIKWASIYKGDGASYCEGFVSGLFTQLKTARKIESQSSTTAMILVERREDLIKYKQNAARNWLEKARGKKLRKAQTGGGSSTGSYEAYSEGRSDGSRTDVNATRRKKIEA